MGLFNHFVGGTATASRHNLMERLSSENGWTPDYKDDESIALFFTGDAITPRRDVIIVHPPGQWFASFSCACRASFVARAMTPGQVALFLARNKESLFGKWQMAIGDDGMVKTFCRYTALTNGLDAGQFKTLCNELVHEVAFVEAELHGQGML